MCLGLVRPQRRPILCETSFEQSVQENFSKKCPNRLIWDLGGVVLHKKYSQQVVLVFFLYGGREVLYIYIYIYIDR